MDDPKNNDSLVAKLNDRKKDVLDDLKQIEKPGMAVDVVIEKRSADIDGKKEKTNIEAVADVPDKFWSNEIIWEIVAGYLNISDLKSFSCTNKYFLQRVRSLSRFASLSGQLVIDRMEIHVFKLTRAIVEVSKIRSNALRTKSEETFKDTEYLELHCLDQLSDPNLNSRLIQIVSHCPKLKSLVLTPLNGLEKNLDIFFKNSNVRQVLSNLNELHLEVEKNCTEDEPLPEYRVFAHHGEPDSLHLCKMFPDLPMKLTSFSYTEPDWSYRSWFSPSMVLGSSQNTLVKLNLKMPPKPTLLADLVTLKFPKLEKLNLNIKSRRFEKTREIVSPEEFTTIVLPFLKNHMSTLTEFKLWYDIDITLEVTPFQELLKSATKIKVLDFIIQDASLVYTYSDWDFLKTIATLHSFEMKLPCSEDIHMEDGTSVCNSFIDYLNVLPSTIRSINFGGVRVSGVGRLPLISQITSSMMRFQYVTTLKLHLCLDDQIIGFICKHFSQLLVLEAYFNFVSNHGICGISEDGCNISERSLSNLKGLKKLVMKASFPHTYHHHDQFLITWGGLIIAVHFLGLVELRVEDSLSTPYSETELGNPEGQTFQDRNFLRLVSSHRNPSLEKVYVKSYVPGSHILEELKTVNSRIKL